MNTFLPIIIQQGTDINFTIFTISPNIPIDQIMSLHSNGLFWNNVEMGIAFLTSQISLVYRGFNGSTYDALGVSKPCIFQNNEYSLFCSSDPISETNVNINIRSNVVVTLENNQTKVRFWLGHYRSSFSFYY